MVAMLLAGSVLPGCMRTFRPELRNPSLVSENSPKAVDKTSAAAAPHSAHGEDALPGVARVARKDEDSPLDPAVLNPPFRKPPAGMPSSPSQPAPSKAPTNFVSTDTPNDPTSVAQDEVTAPAPEDRAPAPSSSQKIAPHPTLSPWGRGQGEGAAPKDEPLVEAMRAILANRHEDAIQHLKAYGVNEEVFLRLLPVMAWLTKKPLEELSPEESAALSGQLERLAELLRPRSELVLKNVCCCDWVKSFGVFKPVPHDHAFMAATRTAPGELVQVYAEIGNICCKKHDNHHVTQLSSSVEIHDRAGKQVYYHFFGRQPVQTLTPLRDYYNNYSFYVPNKLPPGTYTLTIHVTDETYPERRRVASKSIEFRVSGLPNLP